ncbi:MAG: TIGR02186 family protein [Hyphomicrobiaceae bacterium]
MRRAGWTTKRGLSGLALILLAMTLVLPGIADAQQRRRPQRATPLPVPERILPSKPADPADPEAKLPRETVQADISTRRIAITSSFSGTEIVVFGAVDNSRQKSAEAGLYDIVIVLVGTPTRLVARQKSRVAGVWLNTDQMRFASVPSFYAIVSTRPVDEISTEEVLKSTGIGFDFAPMTLEKGQEKGRSAADIKGFRDAIVRLKQKDRLFSEEEYGVAFIGRSLFRAAVTLPANITVGPFETRVYLFRNQELIHQYSARLDLEREGIEDTLHAFAFSYPFFYGLATVLMAIGSGLLASSIFRRVTG